MKKGDFELSKFIFNTIEILLIALAVFLFAYLTLFSTNVVEGNSMEPNYSDGELLLSNKAITWFSPTSLGKAINYDYQNGDVIVFHKADGEEYFLKRIIASGGEVVKISDNKVYVNGQELDERYLPITTRTHILPYGTEFFAEDQEITVPEDQFFVLGDNRDISKDSRYLEVGFVQRSEIDGRVFFRFWPLSGFGIIRRGNISTVIE